MVFNKIIRPSVGARFIAPTADLSALGACSDVRIKNLTCIIGQMDGQAYSDYFVKPHHCARYQDRAFTRNVYIRG